MSGVSSKASDETHERLDNLFRILKVLMDNKFTGYIKLNFTQGSLGRVEKFEEILKK
jgi:predicted DNA-binding helix-hairpin-helix protein